MGSPAKIALDTGLLLGFALPHSLLFTRDGRRLLERWLPRELFYLGYGLISSVSLLVLYALWQPLGGPFVWRVEGGVAAPLLLALNGLAWALMGVSLYHYGLLRQPGLAHGWAWLRGRAYRPPALVESGPFRYVRHPIYVAMGLMLWVTPWMSRGHLLTAVVWSAYLVAGALHKEARLRRALGDTWIAYRARVPAVLAPASARGLLLRLRGLRRAAPAPGGAGRARQGNDIGRAVWTMAAHTREQGSDQEVLS